MAYRIHSTLGDVSPNLHVFDASSGSVRLAREATRMAPEISEEERLLMSLRREEAFHDLLRRRFLRTTEQYLKSELDDLGQPRKGR
jgi:hypothetical protein